MRFWNGVKAYLSGEVEAKSISLIDPLASDIFGAIPSMAGSAIGPATAIRVPAVHSAIALIAGAIGSLPAKVFDSDEGGKRTAKDHPAYPLIHDWANDWTSAGELRAQLALIGGGMQPKEAYELTQAYVAKRPIAESFPLVLSILETVWLGAPADTQGDEADNG